MKISLRLKLTLISLLLLLIPLIGFRFSAVITRDLVASRKETLMFAAQAVASALTGRTGLFDQELFHSLNRSRDLYLFELSHPIRLNGEADDWQPQIEEAEEFGADHLLAGAESYTRDSLHFRHMLGVRGDYLYAIFLVQDDQVVYRAPNSLGIDRADHLQIGIEDRHGTLHRYLVTTTQPGWVNGFLLPPNPDDILPVTLEPQIQGVWADAPGGYVIELRIPKDLIGNKFAFALADVDDRNSRDIAAIIGTATPTDPEKLGWLLSPSKVIEEILQSLDRPQSRILIVDSNQRIRASYGSLQQDQAPSQHEEENLPAAFSRSISNIVKPVYNLFTKPFLTDFQAPIGLPATLDLSGVQEGLQGKSSITSYRIAKGQVEIMAAITPLKAEDKIVGAVVVEQTTNSILALQNKVIEESLSLTILAFFFGALGLLLFASRLSARIRHLRNEAAEAITANGQIHASFQPTRARDEIGDLSRTLATMLRQLKEQIDYRETMADNLEHEIRTPLAGISASLQNIRQELEQPPERISNYLNWALEDLGRLEGLLTAIRDATSLQEALEQDIHEDFNLSEAVPLWLSHGWRPAFAQADFHYDPPKEDLFLHGTPGRIRQMLDKLVENGVSFHYANTPIEIGLKREGRVIELTVANQGPPIPEEMQGQIFNSMVSLRARHGTGPHLGLGLYIARTIATHHQGSITARNLTDGREGVIFAVRLPLHT